MLRVTDILLENVINSALDWDQRIELDRTRGQEKGVHSKQTVQHICNLGISFKVWEETNADGKASGRYAWTSLIGDDKKKLLRHFPRHENTINIFQDKQLGKQVIDVWMGFSELYNIITSWTPSQNAATIHLKAVSFIKSFLLLNGKMKGFGRCRVTPYMHILVAHVPHFLKMHKSIKIITAQGVEKNDVAQSTVLRKSNKWDSTGDVLRLEHRQWVLREQERAKKKLHKREFRVLGRRH